MIIGFNMTAFIPGTMGGMEFYCRNILRSLQEVDAVNRYNLICDAHYANEIILTNPNFRILPCNFTQPSYKWLIRGAIRNITGIDILRPVMNRVEADVIHHPFSMLNPRHLSIPSVLTFHDMQHEYFPYYFSAFEMKTRKEFYRASAEEATRIIADSHHTKSTLIERYGISAEKIDVVHLGHAPEFTVIDDIQGLQEIRNRYGLDKPFIYYPAATWPHKNHLALLSAVKIMKDRYGFDGNLVLTGVKQQSQGEIAAKIVRLGLQDMVRPLGYLSTKELPYLYNLARIMVFPSLFEGFGIPIVEAMACGCPVTCSATTSIPEVAGDAAIMFDPSSVEDIAEKAWRLWTDDSLRQTLIKLGRQRAGLFSWNEAAQKTISVYQKVCK